MTIKLCYFNQHWNIYLYSNDEDKNKWSKHMYLTTIIHHEDFDREYRLRKYEHPEIPCLYFFGVYYYDKNKRPGHDGEWSSRSEVINPIFGKDLYEVAVDQTSMAVSLKWLKELLGDKVVWGPFPVWGEVITSVIGENNTPDKWVTIE